MCLWGSRGTGNGQFNVAWGIATDTSGNIYVTDAKGRAQVFDGDGRFLCALQSEPDGDGKGSAYQEIAVSADGNVYVADTPYNRVHVFRQGRLPAGCPPLREIAWGSKVSQTFKVRVIEIAQLLQVGGIVQ